MRPEPPIELKQPKVIVAEGLDAKLFILWAYQWYGIQDVQGLDYGGITELRKYLGVLQRASGFSDVQTLLIARDAELDSAAAFQSARHSLSSIGLPTPDSPFSFTSGNPRTAVVIFPGLEDGELVASGSLEDLCLKSVGDDPLMECVEEYIVCARGKSEPLRSTSKSRLHTFLSAKAGFAGLKIGEATKAGAWQLDHPTMQPFKEMITGM